MLTRRNGDESLVRVGRTTGAVDRFYTVDVGFAFLGRAVDITGSIGADMRQKSPFSGASGDLVKAFRRDDDLVATFDNETTLIV